MQKAAANVRSTTASGSVVYESERAVHEYLQFHFGDPAQVVPYSFAPQDALAFLPRTVEECVAHVPAIQRHRALDIGCAVGRATFELSKHFDHATGIDFSHHFADTANKMKELGELEYEAHIQGDIREVRKARLPAGVKPANVTFQQGDACNLSPSLGKFDAIFASNLLCRLPDPEKFLSDISGFVNKDGILALISPYSWLEEYTAKDKWIGATVDAQGEPVDSFSVIEQHLRKDFDLVKRQDYPFMIREHARKFQWGVSDGTFWKRK
ncbi:putative 4-mercaptohistidine n1-methyltransferase, ovoa c-terminal domain [Globisporangium polare]